jgi:hypothetical protein
MNSPEGHLPTSMTMPMTMGIEYIIAFCVGSRVVICMEAKNWLAT